MWGKRVDPVAAVFSCLARESISLAYSPSLSYQIDADSMPDDVAAVGLDTNALKQLRWEPLVASSLTSWTEANGVALIVPGQALQEFWNNHRIFVKGTDVLEKDLDNLSRSAKKILDSTTDENLQMRIREISDSLEVFDRESKDMRDPELLKKSAALWAEIELVAMVPHVPRDKFGPLGEARFASKTPPGFEDHDKFPRHLGDYFVWADFLLGLRHTHEAKQLREGRVVFFTEDAKLDWMTSGKPHPTLAAEVMSLVDRPLEIRHPREISGLVGG